MTALRRRTTLANGEYTFYANFYRAVINDKRVKEGFGVLSWGDGSKYEGQFLGDKMSGQGRMTQANGDTYQGQWRNGMANGYGTFVDSQGSTYEGEWMDDLQNGYGCETWN